MWECQDLGSGKLWQRMQVTPTLPGVSSAILRLPGQMNRENFRDPSPELTAVDRDHLPDLARIWHDGLSDYFGVNGPAPSGEGLADPLREAGQRRSWPGWFAPVVTPLDTPDVSLRGRRRALVNGQSCCRAGRLVDLGSLSDRDQLRVDWTHYAEILPHRFAKFRIRRPQPAAGINACRIVGVWIGDQHVPNRFDSFGGHDRQLDQTAGCCEREGLTAAPNARLVDCCMHECVPVCGHVSRSVRGGTQVRMGSAQRAEKLDIGLPSDLGPLTAVLSAPTQAVTSQRGANAKERSHTRAYKD